jgi:hypothetical protein
MYFRGHGDVCVDCPLSVVPCLPSELYLLTDTEHLCQHTLQVVALADLLRELWAQKLLGGWKLSSILLAAAAVPSTAMLVLRSAALTGTFSLASIVACRCAPCPACQGVFNPILALMQTYVKVA